MDLEFLDLDLSINLDYSHVTDFSLFVQQHLDNNREDYLFRIRQERMNAEHRSIGDNLHPIESYNDPIILECQRRIEELGDIEDNILKNVVTTVSMDFILQIIKHTEQLIRSEYETNEDGIMDEDDENHDNDFGPYDPFNNNDDESDDDLDLNKDFGGKKFWELTPEELEMFFERGAKKYLKDTAISLNEIFEECGKKFRVSENDYKNIILYLYRYGKFYQEKIYEKELDFVQQKQFIYEFIWEHFNLRSGKHGIINRKDVMIDHNYKKKEKKRFGYFKKYNLNTKEVDIQKLRNNISDKFRKFISDNKDGLKNKFYKVSYRKIRNMNKTNLYNLCIVADFKMNKKIFDGDKNNYINPINFKKFISFRDKLEDLKYSKKYCNNIYKIFDYRKRSCSTKYNGFMFDEGYYHRRMSTNYKYRLNLCSRSSFISENSKYNRYYSHLECSVRNRK